MSNGKSTKSKASKQVVTSGASVSSGKTSGGYPTPTGSTIVRRAPRPRRQPRQTGWLWPTRGTRISQGVYDEHRALDIPGARGEPIVAPRDAVVQEIKWQPGGYGLNIRLLTEDGFYIILAHLDAVVSSLSPGSRVSAGDLLGQLGSTGRSTGPHLHFEVRPAAFAVDRFVPGTSAGMGAIDPLSLYQDGQPSQTASLPRTSSASFQYAPTTQPSVTLRTDSTAPGGISASKSAPATSSAEEGLITSAGAVRPGPTPTAKPTAQKSKEGAADSEGSIPILDLPLGQQVRLRLPGERFMNYAAIALGVLLIAVGLYLATRGDGKDSGRDPAGNVKAALSGDLTAAADMTFGGATGAARKRG